MMHNGAKGFGFWGKIHAAQQFNWGTGVNPKWRF
jgi:hypothetical protein